MSRVIHIPIIIIAGLTFLACGEKKETKTKAPNEMPFKKVTLGESDPGDNGPGDGLSLNAVNGTMGSVTFNHFTHASATSEGYGIGCQNCHHNVNNDNESSSCSECHLHPTDGDMAHAGPEDNLVLVNDSPIKSEKRPVPFNHFTHASQKGYNIPCQTCHHKEDNLGKCDSCHLTRATEVNGKAMPKQKRAAHLLCKGCHTAHKNANDDSSAPTACDECHKHGPMVRPTGKIPLNRAYHLSCIDCHRKVLAANENATAPTHNCKGCHKKGKASIQSIMPKVKKQKTLRTAKEPKASTDSPAKPDTQADGGVPKAEVADVFPIKLGLKNKKTVPFTHKDHQDYADSCESCHHKGLSDPKCSNCHKAEEAKTIYHKQCINCHKENDAPSGCSNCHPK